MPRRDRELIVDVAMNGIRTKAQNPNVPETPAEIAAEAERLFAAGVTIIHAHNSDHRVAGRAAADDYLAAWGGVHTRHPEALWYPTIAGSDRPLGDLSHVAILAKEAGVRIGCVDPGPVISGLAASDGTPAGRIYANTADDIHSAFAFLADRRLGAEIGIYEPGFLRTALAYHRAGKLPQGSIINLYFCGRRGMFDSERSTLYGLPPTAASFEAYFAMLEDADLPWKTSVWGEDILDTPIAELTLQRGGHIQIGLENHAQSDTGRSNLDSFERLVRTASAQDRPIATSRVAAALLDLPG